MIILIHKWLKVDKCQTPMKKVSQNKQNRRIDMDIVDIEKLYSLHIDGLSLNKLSIMYNLPYVSLYRAIKEYKSKLSSAWVELKKNKTINKNIK